MENLTLDMGDYTPRSVEQLSVARATTGESQTAASSKSAGWGSLPLAVRTGLSKGTMLAGRCREQDHRLGRFLSPRRRVWSSHGHVINNVCEGAGITFAGDDGIIARNRISRSGYGSGIFVQGSPSTHSATIIGNICSGGSSGYDDSQGGKWWSVNGFEVWAPDSVICNNMPMTMTAADSPLADKIA